MNRRISSATELQPELSAWQIEHNRTASQVQWRFATEDARIKLQYLYA